MQVNFNVTKEERKRLVSAVSEIIGVEAKYQGAPSMAYKVGDYTVSRNGTFIGDIPQTLLDVLEERGFVGEIEDDAAVELTMDKYTITMPLIGLSDTALTNLENLITAKAWIIKKMTYATELPLVKNDEHLDFPWFNCDASSEEIAAYANLVVRMYETAKLKKRISAKIGELMDGDNEKFKARCFLLSLGFIGEEYAQARKILLAPMSGSGSHKSGSHKRGKAADNGEDVAEVVTANAEDSVADNADTSDEVAD